MSKRKKTWEEKHPNAITDAMVKSGVKKKAERMQAELKRNPNNRKTAARLAEFKNLHRGKLQA